MTGQPTQRSRPALITPSQRAAVIIALLGEDAARPIVEKLDDAALAQVANALEQITFLAREELVEIAIDFLSQLRRTAGALRGGPGRARALMAGLVDARRLDALFGGVPVQSEVEPSADLDVWSRLRQRDPKQAADYLARLTPGLVAIVLRKLDPAASSAILCLLPEEKVTPILGRMVDPPPDDPGLEAVIERMIEMEFLNKAQQSAGPGEGHLEMIGEVLSLIPPERRNVIVSFLKAQHEAKLPIIERGLFTIEGLPAMLPRNAVPIVFREVDPATLFGVLVSLRDGAPDVLEFLLSNISSRMAEQFKADVKDAPAPSQEDTERLQRAFLTSLMDLKRQGLISVTRPAAA